MELPFVQLYDGQHLWLEIIDRFEAEGFTLWAFKPVFFDQATGRTLQVDGVFTGNHECWQVLYINETNLTTKP